MRFRGKIIAVLLGSAALGTPAFATTLQDAFVQTYSTNPSLSAARAQLRATDEGVPLAKSQSRLQVSSTLGLSQSSNGIDHYNNGARDLTAQLNLTYPLFQGGRVKNSINAAQTRVIAGRADLRTAEGNIFVAVVSAYMDVIRDASIVDLNRKNVDVLNTNLKASRDRFQVGDLTRTDVAQSEARLSLAHQGPIALHRVDQPRELGEDGGLVSAAGADLQHPVALVDLQRLGHQADDERLADGLAAGDRQRAVLERAVLEEVLGEQRPGRGLDGVQHGGIAHALRAQGEDQAGEPRFGRVVVVVVLRRHLKP